DITDKDKAEEKIITERNLLRMLIHNLPDAIYVKDSQGRKIITNSMDLQLMSQRSEAAVIGKTDLEIYPDNKGRKSFDDDMQVLKTGEPLVNKEETFYNVEGKELCVLTTKMALRNEHGEITGLLGMGRDFTDRKKAEIELLRLNQDLKKRAEELAISNEELEHFAYIASHDLQEPLRMVSGFLALLKKNYKSQLDDKAQQYIDFAVDGSDRMKRLIMDLLEYSKVGTTKEMFVATDMNLIMDEVTSNFIKQDEHNDNEPIIIYPKLPVIYANNSQMMQLLQNLVGNAIKYKSAERPRIEIQFKEEANQYLFSVTDNGIGIDPDNYSKIFILFHRLHVKEESSGTGIGLAICKKIVERHGGNIWIESEKGKGSTFYFTIRKQG
ncbi:MAG: ATP-binding protein, partial [Ferruginibacter sp.]